MLGRLRRIAADGAAKKGLVRFALAQTGLLLAGNVAVILLTMLWFRGVFHGFWLKQFRAQAEILGNGLRSDTQDRLMLLQRWRDEVAPQTDAAALLAAFNKDVPYFRDVRVYGAQGSVPSTATRMAFRREGIDKILDLDACRPPDRRGVATCVAVRSILNLQAYVRSDPKMRNFRFDVVRADDGATALEIFPFNAPFAERAAYRSGDVGARAGEVAVRPFDGADFFVMREEIPGSAYFAVIMAPVDLFRRETAAAERAYGLGFVLIGAVLFGLHLEFFRRKILLPMVELRQYESLISAELGVPARADAPHGEFHVLRSHFENLYGSVQEFRRRQADHERELREEIVRLEKERQGALEQLIQTEKMAVMSRLMAGVAHEIRNPLTSIQLTLDNIKRGDGRLSERMNAHLAILNEEIGRLSGILTRFLGLGKKHQDANFARKNLNDVAAQAVRLMEAEAQAREIALTAELDPAVPDGDWIFDEIFSAVVNLIKNAVEAVPAGGRIVVRTARTGGESILAVDDTGPGVPPEIVDKIFDVFFTTKADGSGLGLAQVLQAVSLHHGKIAVRRSALGGAAMELRFTDKEAGA